MVDPFQFRRNRFDALHALLVGDFRGQAAGRSVESARHGRDVGGPGTAARGTLVGFAARLVWFRR